jgi:hypothetical protein
MNDIEWELITSCNCICQEVIFMFTSLSPQSMKGEDFLCQWGSESGALEGGHVEGELVLPDLPTISMRPNTPSSLCLFNHVQINLQRGGGAHPCAQYVRANGTIVPTTVLDMSDIERYMSPIILTLFFFEKCRYNVGILALKRANMFRRMTCKFHLTILVPLPCML